MSHYIPQVGDRVKLSSGSLATRAVILSPIDEEGEYLVHFEDGYYPGARGYIGAEEIAGRADMPPADIFDHTDSWGDSLTVYTRPNHPGEPVAVTANADTEEDDEQTVCLSPAAVARLRAALEPFDPTA